MYQALYRKYRPHRFSDVTGQEHITETLRRQILLGRLSHAYLFVGTRGTGKTTCAKILSRAVNCANLENGDPCGKCDSCVGIESGAILDVLEIDAASNSGVDNVRNLREEAIYSPATVSRRVYIIDEVHMLSTAAFNALLKILEEPPEHLIFILATTDLHKVPATILSRCQRFSFKRLSPASISARLKYVAKNEGLNLTEDAAERLTLLSDGSLRDALSLLDQCSSDSNIDLQRVLDTIGLAAQDELLRIADAIAGNDVFSVLDCFDKLYREGGEITSLLGELSSLFRDTLVYKLSPDSPLLGGVYGRSDISALSAKTNQKELLTHLETIRETLTVLSRGGKTKLTAEICLIKMCALAPTVTAMPEMAEESTLAPTVTAAPTVATAPTVAATPTVTAAPTVTEAPTVKATPASAPAVTATPETLEESSIEIVSPDIVEDDFWQAILSLLKDDMSVHSFLSDNSKVRAELQAGKLTIITDNEFSSNMIKMPMFLEPLTKAAEKALDRAVNISIEITESANAAPKIEKLEELRAFDIVTYE